MTLVAGDGRHCLPITRPPHPAGSMSTNRLSARLGQLPHDVLAELAARLCSESPALQAIAEECLAANSSLPQALVEGVLLSADLTPHILGPLGTEDGACAAVSSQWLTGWNETNETRRRLKQVPFEFPEEIDTGGGLDMTSTPDGRLVVRTATEVHILDRTMRVSQTLGSMCSIAAASNDSIFGCVDRTLLRSTIGGALVAQFQLEGYYLIYPVLAAAVGLLFCVIYLDGEAARDEIIALDAQTLQLRHRFGRGLLNNAQQLTVVRDELYVCDTNNHRLQVFSLTGEHRRSVTGEWRSPEQLCFVKDRLYLVEQKPPDADIAAKTSAFPSQGHRILVLSLQGDILQVVTHPTEPTAEFRSMLCFDHKLLARYYYYAESLSPRRRAGFTLGKFGMLALQGL